MQRVKPPKFGDSMPWSNSARSGSRLANSRGAAAWGRTKWPGLIGSNSQGNALAVPVVTWVVDPTPDSAAVLLRLEYGLSREGHAQEMVQLILTPSQLRELALDLSETAKTLSRTIDSGQGAAKNEPSLRELSR